MTVIHRMQVLEQRAGKILLKWGYETVIVSNFVRSSRYIAFNLTARKKLDDGTIDTVMVKLKIALHPIESLAEAAMFCRDEIGSVRKFYNRVPLNETPSRFEVWISVPRKGFQQFEITHEGIREIRLYGKEAPGIGGAA